jgi:periplasmic divalent cation tolerance protein
MKSPQMVQEFQIGGTSVIVEQRLAACANIMPGMISHYRWEGKVERSEEVLVIFKTRSSLADAVR